MICCDLILIRLFLSHYSCNGFGELIKVGFLFFFSIDFSILILSFNNVSVIHFGA